MKTQFNDMFVKMWKIKDNEMNVIAQHNERLNQIHHDINLFQRLNADKITKFNPIRTCEYFKDSDTTHSIMLAISSYNIDSQFDDSLDSDSKKSVKTDRNQSFYKRALDEMMDGVLQVSREDKLKKDPPKPMCMLEKKFDSEFTETEMVQINEYHKKMAQIHDDRRMYISKLFDEKAKLENLIESMVCKLNRCLENIIKTKVNAQFAITSEQLKILFCVRDHMKFNGFDKTEKQFQ